ncbi:MAG: hypothetical protein AcusKO_23200 [Acuticoccus sp.]
MPLSLDALRRRAKSLRTAHAAGEPQALQRVAARRPADAPLTHATFLHIIAREENFESWPKLKLAAETQGLDRAAREQRLKIALHQGQNALAEHLLAATPDLADGLLGLEIALYRRAVVERALAADPAAATRPIAGRPPLHFLCWSKWYLARPALRADMLTIAKLLVDHGADVNEGVCGRAGQPAHAVAALRCARPCRQPHAGGVSAGARRRPR